MHTATLTNPNTKRPVHVRMWEIDNQEVTSSLLSGEVKTSRDLSWKLLSQKKSLRSMERTESGDCAANNLALSVFENALDWSLGQAVLNFRIDCRSVKKRPPAKYHVAAASSGAVFIVVESPTKGQVVLPY